MNKSAQARPKRISVIGCPGAGKTCFSRRLAEITQLPLVHLDLIYHDQAYSYRINKESWRKRMTTEVKKNRWLIDGNYKSTFDIRLPRSDMIIFLDYPTRINISRAIKRRFRFRKTVRRDMPPTWKEHLDWGFFTFILKFNHEIAPRMRQLLDSYQDKDIVILKSPRATHKYLENLRSSVKG